jgi:hypothetical protein
MATQPRPGRWPRAGHHSHRPDGEHLVGAVQIEEKDSLVRRDERLAAIRREIQAAGIKVADG